MYQFPRMNVVMRHHKHILIKGENTYNKVNGKGRKECMHVTHTDLRPEEAESVLTDA